VDLERTLPLNTIMDRRVLVYNGRPTLCTNPILERKELTMSQDNLNEVPQIFPHTIAVYSIKHSRAAFDLIKWCIDNFQNSWHKHMIEGVVYIQMSKESDLSLFLLYWAQDDRIDYTIIDINQMMDT